MQRQSGPPSAAKRKSKDSPGEPRGPAFRLPCFIVLEGPIRVGKSTLAKVLAERLHARRVFDCEDNPFLADFYNEKPGAAFRAQMYFLMERHRRLHEALAVEAPGPVLADFLFEKDKIFANLNLDADLQQLLRRLQDPVKGTQYFLPLGQG